MKNLKIRKTIEFIIAFYLVNRITYLSLEVFKHIIYYDYDDHLFLEINANSIEHVVHLNNLLLHMVPFNPYYLFGWFPIITLNFLTLLIYYKKRTTLDHVFHRIVQYFFSIIGVFMLSVMMFMILSFFNDYQNHVICDRCISQLLLETYAPYVPQMICGFLMGNIIFSVIWIFIMEKFFYKSNK